MGLRCKDAQWHMVIFVSRIKVIIQELLMSKIFTGRNIPRPILMALICVSQTLSVHAYGQSVELALEDIVSTISPEIIELRHQIHQYPELSNREFKTSALVAAHLEALGIETQTGVAHTGVVGVLRGGRSGPVVAVRADMDALPITEQNNLLFRSLERAIYNGEEVGVMHACGHDIHTAVLLGVASTLAQVRDSLAGTVIFIFQPAEEGPPPGEEGGASLMLKENVFGELKPEAIYALHTNTALQTGQIGYAQGGVAAASDTFSATLIGQQSHAAFPELGIDPVVMGAQAVLALQSIPSRNISVFEPTVVSVTKFHGGVRTNIIPESVTLEGTVRVFSEDSRNKVEQRMRQILKGISESAGGHSEFSYKRGHPALINDDSLLAESVPVLQDALGAEMVIKTDPVMAGEDFSLYTKEIPGFFLFLGVVKPGTVSGPNHSPAFLADDGSIAVGIKALSSLVISKLKYKQ